MLSIFLASLAALLPIANPLGAVAAYASMTERMAASEQRRQAWMTGVYVAGILVVFALLGATALQAFGISIPALQIAGGLVVMHSGFSMIVLRPKITDAEQAHSTTKEDVSFSPMALPLIAGPGAIGVVIGLAARHTHWDQRLGIVAAAIILGAVVAVFLRYATPLVDRMGATGIGALTRVMGFLILAIGVELLVHGVRAAFSS
ncbi:MarC family protein [Rarobacter incanus]|uniref:UPF0056 membrane protein n=1 Tax=Rarobacter incanus TaxID=153494 RepID=A0A542SMM6_9MICO|nr:MarC family protein [Rarobacter incanus]TQK75876.1 multiple antibiotic resistance protein [Rarobacter incanus]